MHLVGCEPELLQGDVFGLPVALPRASLAITACDLNAGGGGSAAPPGTPYRLTVEVVAQHDGTLAPTAFQGAGLQTHDPSYVVARTVICDYFLLGSQSCDVSGEGKLDLTCIVPFWPLGRLLGSELLPITSSSERDGRMSIVSYLTQEYDEDFSGVADVDMDMPDKVRATITKHLAKAATAQKDVLKRLRKLISEELVNPFRKSTYYLPAVPALCVPEGYADLGQVYTIPLAELEERRDKRLAQLSGSYREHFSRQLGDLLSRVAVPEPLRPPSR